MSDWVRLRGRAAAAVVAPRLGGRLLQFEAAGREWLWVNPKLLDGELRLRADPEQGQAASTIGDWFNYGGDKCWPAPQAQLPGLGWVGPPDPVLDAGPYNLVDMPDAHGASVTMRSRIDPVTGLAIERTITVHEDEPQLTTVNRVVNCGEASRAWSVWTVAQVRTDLGGRIEVDVDPSGRPHVELGTYDGAPLDPLFHGGLASLHVLDRVGKVGFPSAHGVLTYHDPDGRYLRLSFSTEEDAAYPDDGSRAEIWMQYPVAAPLTTLSGWQPDARLAELECLSPLVTLEPGESVSLSVTWLAGAVTSS